jgi:hypothetical protein
VKEAKPEIIIQTLEEALVLADKAFCEIYNKHNEIKIEEGIEVWINQVLEKKIKQKN